MFLRKHLLTLICYINYVKCLHFLWFLLFRIGPNILHLPQVSLHFAAKEIVLNLKEVKVLVAKSYLTLYNPMDSQSKAKI